MATMTSARMEAFSDGVMAVILTIMVLELHVPKQNGWAGFVSVLPLLAIYALSFLMVGIYWLNHHELLRRSESIDARVLWANLAFLFALSLIPYSTDYVGEKHFDSFSASLYTVALLLSGLSFLWLRHTLMYLQSARNSLEEQDRIENKKHLLSLGVYALALPVAFLSPLTSFGLDTAVTLLWILPDLGTKHHMLDRQKQHKIQSQRDTL